MDKLAVWAETLPVRFNAVDRSDTMTLNTVFALFQEAAISHAENLGVGREDMAAAGQVWILSRMSVRVDRRPAYREQVTVRSWPRGWEKLFAIRDFDVLGSGGSGAPVIRGRSCWIIIDIEKRRPMRPQAIMDRMPLNEGLDALASVPPALEARPAARVVSQCRALYNDVDYVGHVNNVSYIRWLENALDPSLLERAKRSRLDVNYVNEVLPGESVELLLSEFDAAPEYSAGFAFEGRKAGGLTAFRAELRVGF